MYFPQLSTGASSQFPTTRQRQTRTVINESCQGYQVKLADPGAAITEWHLSFAELNDQELAAIEALFQSVEGSLTPFTFLDPTANLLVWSEQLDQPAWQADPLLTLTGGVSDPLGGSAAWQVNNPSAAALNLQQTIQAPASLNYCLSLYARSDASPRVSMLRGAATAAEAIGPQWTRLIFAGQLDEAAESISFGIAVDPGATVDIFGIQVEAQTSASLYKRTTEAGGVYPNARFRGDTLTVTTVGPGRHCLELDIVNVDYI